MSLQLDAEFVWFIHEKRVTMGIYVKPGIVRKLRSSVPTTARVSNTYVEVIRKLGDRYIYRCPTTLAKIDGVWVSGPIFAILAGSESGSFQGSQLNFRDIMQEAKSRRIFVYVLPVAHVTDKSLWDGYVRLGYKRWTSISCPRPQAVYNRIPTRYLENRPQTILAKQKLHEFRIPTFNPNYFNKATIYEIIHNAGLSHYLPKSSNILTKSVLFDMLHKSYGVYLKPAGGSVGHGMIRIEQEGKNGYIVQTLKNGVCDFEVAGRLLSVWKIVEKKRVPGRYVLQEAIPLILWHGHPCDFRVLLQKYSEWRIVGKGVRVSGPRTITTHVPSGGHIANAAKVLTGTFGTRAEEMESRVNRLAVDCARAIDNYYGGELGEMSMDIGMDSEGRPWFFEANAKPMKFDEPEIRAKSIVGVVDLLLQCRFRDH